MIQAQNLQKGIGEEGRTLRQMLEDRERATKGTGCYAGITGFWVKERDPIKYELLHARILSSLIAGREACKMISASPSSRECSELAVVLFTPEGHCIAASTGIQVHTVPMGVAIQWAITNGYEQDPGINEGDVFTNNDCRIAGLHPMDVYDIIPIFYKHELVGWVGTVIMEMDVGAAGVPPHPCYHNVERFTDGRIYSMEKTGTNYLLRRDFLIGAERSIRYPHMFLTDRKGALAANVKVIEDVKHLIEEFDLDYYKRATREIIEESRMIQIQRIRQRTVPGRLRNPFHVELYLKNCPVPAYARKNVIRLVPCDVEIKPDGEITVDFEGAGEWGWHAMNASPAGLYGALGITLVHTLSYDGRANYGTLLPCHLRTPPESILNPSNQYIASAQIWGTVIPFGASFLEMLSRGYYSRGFREEIILGAKSPGWAGIGYNSAGHPRRQIVGDYSSSGDHFFMGQQSGARGIADGIDDSIYNPETDMGSTEVCELGMHGLWIGARFMPDSGGFGKYRGGINLCATEMLHGVDWSIGETMPLSTMNKILYNSGIFGGYPGGIFYIRIVKNANTRQLIESRLPLPNAEGDPRSPDIMKLVKGDFVLVKMGWATDEPLHDYDLIQICYNNNNGGYGDPIDRDTELIRADLDRGWTSAETCRNIYCAEPVHDGHKDEWTIDTEKTKDLRQKRKTERLKRGIPFKEWWIQTRAKLLRGEIEPMLAEMYRSSMKMGPRFAEEFRSFWSLPHDFTFGGE